MNIEREWELRPPREPMTSMGALWRDFTWRRADPASPICRDRDNIPDWCREAWTADEALRRAVRSKRPNGKMHNHQSKVSLALPKYERTLKYVVLPNINKIEGKSFDYLHKVLWKCRTTGIGPMTVYDVAVRFGAYLSLEPDRIYVHAGTLAGLKALGIRIFPGDSEIRTVAMKSLPYLLRNRRPDDVEDFLCTYRMAFERL
jgi:hypothetical protein